MHLKNGRPAKAGDRVVNLATGHAGVLYGLTPQSTTCNGRLAAVSASDQLINLKDCVHVDDLPGVTVPDHVIPAYAGT